MALWAILNKEDNGNAAIIRAEEMRFARSNAFYNLFLISSNRYASIKLFREAAEDCRKGRLHEVVKLLQMGIGWCEKYVHTFGRSPRMLALSQDFLALLTHVQVGFRSDIPWPSLIANSLADRDHQAAASQHGCVLGTDHDGAFPSQ